MIRLKSGGKKLELGANRLTDRQLFFYDNYHNFVLREDLRKLSNANDKSIFIRFF